MMLCVIAIIIDVRSPNPILNIIGSPSSNKKISVNKPIQKCESDYQLDLINQNKGDSGALWKTLNKISSSAPVICIESDGVLQADVKLAFFVYRKQVSCTGQI